MATRKTLTDAGIRAAIAKAKKTGAPGLEIRWRDSAHARRAATATRTRMARRALVLALHEAGRQNAPPAARRAYVRTEGDGTATFTLTAARARRGGNWPRSTVIPNRATCGRTWNARNSARRPKRSGRTGATGRRRPSRRGRAIHACRLARRLRRAPAETGQVERWRGGQHVREACHQGASHARGAARECRNTRAILSRYCGRSPRRARGAPRRSCALPARRVSRSLRGPRWIRDAPAAFLPFDVEANPVQPTARAIAIQPGARPRLERTRTARVLGRAQGGARLAGARRAAVAAIARRATAGATGARNRRRR